MWNLNKKNQIILDIIIVLCWMGIVFTFSNQGGNASTNFSKSIVADIVDMIHTESDFTAQERSVLINKYNHVFRKLAHYTIYLIGGIAIISFMNGLTDKRWKSILFTILIGFAYALSDELHQSFVSGRDSRFTDVMIDTAGVITGIVVYMLSIDILNKIREKRRNKRVYLEGGDTLE